jgi:hypothetical protein
MQEKEATLKSRFNREYMYQRKLLHARVARFPAAFLFSQLIASSLHHKATYRVVGRAWFVEVVIGLFYEIVLENSSRR